MDSKIRDQIRIMLDNNNLDSKKVKYYKMNDISYKMTYDDLFVTYIIINNNVKSPQAKNWSTKRNNIIDYIRSLHNIRLVTVIDIVDSSTISKCISNIKDSHILLLVTNIYEKQIAIDNDVDYYHTNNRSKLERFNNSFNLIRRINIDYIMLLNSNDMIPARWIERAISNDVDLVGKTSQLIIDDNIVYKNIVNNSYAKSINMEGILLFNGIVISKVILRKLKWCIRSKTYKRDLLLSLFDNLPENARITKIRCGAIITIITDNSINNVHDIKQNRLNIVKINKNLEDITFNNYGDLLKLINRGKNIKVFAPKIIKPIVDQIDVAEPVKQQKNILIIRPSKSIIRKAYKEEDIEDENVIIPVRKHVKGRNIIKQTIKKEKKRKIKSTLITPHEVRLMINSDKSMSITVNNEPIQVPETNYKAQYTNRDIELMIKKKITSKNSVNIRDEKVNDQIKEKKYVTKGKNMRQNIDKKKKQKATNNVNDRDIKMMLNNKTDSKVRQFNYDSYKDNVPVTHTYDIPHIIYDRSAHINKNISTKDNSTIITILIVKDIGYNLNTCLRYIGKQTAYTDILLVISQEKHLNVIRRMGYNYTVTDKKTSNHTKILHGLCNVKENNYKYFMIMDSSTIISANWLEEACRAIDSGADNVGADKVYLYSENKVYDADKKDKIFWYGRVFSVKLLKDTNWNPLHNSNETRVTRSLTTKLSSFNMKILGESFILLLHNKKEFGETSNRINSDTKIIQRITAHFIDILYKMTKKIKNNLLKYNKIDKKVYAKANAKVDTKVYSATISIVLPTYNGYPIIKDAISDIKKQKFKDWELIIVDDGSTDKQLVEYLKTVKSKNIVVITHDTNKGLPTALNTGIKHSNGKYWCWTSDDNGLTADFMLRLKDVLDKGYDFVYSDYIYVDKVNSNAKITMNIDYGDINSVISNWKGMPSCMWRRSAMDSIGYYDVNIEGCEDYEYILKTFIMVEQKKIQRVPISLFIYNNRRDTLTYKLGKDKIRALVNQTNKKYKDIYDKIREFMKKINTRPCITIVKDKNRYFDKGIILNSIFSAKYDTMLLTYDDIELLNVIVKDFRINYPILIIDDYDLIDTYNMNPLMIIRPNGTKIACDMLTFRKASKRIFPKPLFLTDRPVIGYITDRLIKIDLLYRIADNPSIQLVIITTDDANISHPNITIIRNTSYSNLCRFMSWFKLCLSDGDITQFNTYMSCGKIVLSMGKIDSSFKIPHYYLINEDNCDIIINNILTKCDIKKVDNENIKYARLIYNTHNPLNKLRIDYTIIYPPLISYDHLKQRPAQLMNAFSKIAGVRSIFFDKNPSIKESISNNFMILGKDKFSNVTDYIEGKIIYYYTFPKHIMYINMVDPDYVIYDLIDNPTEEFQHWMNDDLFSSIKRADLFVCSAQIMYEKYHNMNINTIVVSNACDYSHFNKAITRLERPLDFPNTKKIVIGYYGSHASWVDFELIKKIANYRPDKYTIVMIGRDKVYNLKINHKNIHWINHKSYDILPNYLSWFDICMIPFKLTEMIKGCDPIKLYEYLASGKPVVTTKMDPILKYSNECYFIDHNNYGKVIDSIRLKENIKERLQVAKDNCWDNKAQDIFNNLLEKVTVTVLYPQYIKWHKMFQRPQQMMKAISKIKGIRSVFIDHSIQRDMIIDRNLILTPNYQSSLNYLKGKIIVYFNDPKLINEISGYKHDISVFELVDKPVEEFVTWQSSLNKALLGANYISLTSPELSIYPKKFNLPFSIIPNGADYDHFYNAKDRLEKPTDFPKTNKYIVGYYGAHATWVDWKLIEKIANIKRVHVVMIGKMQKIYDHSFEHPNITWLSIKPYKMLPNYLSWFDVCMIPFKLTDMIKACDPIKLYEFSAAGKPVITTKMEELKKFSDICYFMDHNNYQQVLQKAINERNYPDLIKKRQTIAKNNTWSERAKMLIDTIL